MIFFIASNMDIHPVSQYKIEQGNSHLWLIDFKKNIKALGHTFNFSGFIEFSFIFCLKL